MSKWGLMEAIDGLTSSVFLMRGFVCMRLELVFFSCCDDPFWHGIKTSPSLSVFVLGQASGSNYLIGPNGVSTAC